MFQILILLIIDYLNLKHFIYKYIYFHILLKFAILFCLCIFFLNSNVIYIVSQLCEYFHCCFQHHVRNQLIESVRSFAATFVDHL